MKAQISIRQAVMLLVTTLTSTGHLLFVRIATHYAGRDAWLALVIALITTVLTLWLTVSLLQRHPGRNLPEISLDLFGPFLGRAVGLLFVAEFLLVNALLLRSFGDFMRLTQPQTPLMVLMAVMLVLAERTGRLGLEVLARANDVLLPVLMAAGLAVTLTVSHEKHAYHLLPVLEHGWPPVLAGALALQGLFAEAVVLGMFSPLVTGGRHTLRQALWLVAVLGALFAGPITGPTALFGLHSVQAMFYPTWEEVKQIQLAGITANLDVLGVLLWTLGTFVKATVLLWSTSTGVASLIGLREGRAVMAPVAVITAGLAVLVGGNSTQIVAFLTGIYPLVSIAVGVGLPLLLLLVSLVYKPRKNRRRRAGRPPSRDVTS